METTPNRSLIDLMEGATTLPVVWGRDLSTLLLDVDNTAAPMVLGVLQSEGGTVTDAGQLATTYQLYVFYDCGLSDERTVPDDVQRAALSELGSALDNLRPWIVGSYPRQFSREVMASLGDVKATVTLRDPSSPRL